ncbi:MULTISPECIES: ParB/RepB/Spo0J family partition protein [Atopobiaceae]|uniref:ParB/RepB/Spo0J family partition protein n=1 Tax=Atopobiaceae TaxID=1643824 RepID=UPI00034E3935|nr:MULTISPECIES: ParB/RepB/Spo0J family partition protein [Atopobiaceae]EPD78718.1 ParB family chromosome partitioning protein [Atopobium sp. oral taxon 199 str. F0494]
MAKKSGLGKGLSSLITEANAETGRPKKTETLALSKLKPNKNQPRKQFNETELSELADSIRQNGILQPLLVRKKGEAYEIVAGERRYQAAKQAGLKEIPVIIREISDEEVFKLALIENLQRSNLTPIEEARGYQELIKKDGLTQEQLSKIISKSRSAITNTLRLLDLPDEIQEYMVLGTLSAGHARAILAVVGEEGRLKLAQKVISENLSVRQTENLAPLFSGAEAVKQKRLPTPQSYKRAARQLRMALDTTVKVRNVRGKNKIEIEFADDDELAKLVELLTSIHE